VQPVQATAQCRDAGRRTIYRGGVRKPVDSFRAGVWKDWPHSRLRE